MKVYGKWAKFFAHRNDEEHWADVVEYEVQGEDEEWARRVGADKDQIE